jgi:hypothetical protein
MAREQDVLDLRGALVRRKPQVGDLRWDQDEWRRWNGRRWIRAVASVRPARLKNPTRFADEDVVDDERRARILAYAVEDQVSENGAHVVYEGPRGVVVGYRRHVSHVLHAVLTVITSGLWALVWLAAVAGRREDRFRLEVDSWGNVWVAQLRGA